MKPFFTHCRGRRVRINAPSMPGMIAGTAEAGKEIWRGTEVHVELGMAPQPNERGLRCFPASNLRPF
jgi:hypothetical protein